MDYNPLVPFEIEDVQVAEVILEKPSLEYFPYPVGWAWVIISLPVAEKAKPS